MSFVDRPFNGGQDTHPLIKFNPCGIGILPVGKNSPKCQFAPTIIKRYLNTKFDLSYQKLDFLRYIYALRAGNANASQGFTLIELLVVIFIIGILSAIALPTFLRLIGKAKESEATQYISYLNKHQTAQYLEAMEFTNSFGSLSFPAQQKPSSAAAFLTSLGFFVGETKNYLYGIKTATYDNNPLVVQVALSKDLGTQSYLGIVYVKESIVQCGPVSVPVSLSSPPFKQFQVLQKLL